MKRITQQQIAKALGVSQAFISMVKRGERKISWGMSEKLSDRFPGRTIKEWKYADPKKIFQAFEGK